MEKKGSDCSKELEDYRTLLSNTKISLIFPVMIQEEYAGLCPWSFQGMGERKGGACSFQEKAKNVKMYSIPLLQ